MIKTEAALVKTLLSICDDVDELNESDLIRIVDGISPKTRNKILSTGGAHRITNGNKSMAVFSSMAGKELVAKLGCIQVTTWEWVQGYWVHSVDEEGIPLYGEEYMISVPDKKESEWIEDGVDEFGMPVWIEDITWVSQPDQPTRDQIIEFIDPIHAHLQSVIDEINPRVEDEFGNTRSRIFAMPGGRTPEHLGV